jgi:hypothetical protein
MPLMHDTRRREQRETSFGCCASPDLTVFGRAAWSVLTTRRLFDEIGGTVSRLFEDRNATVAGTAGQMTPAVVPGTGRHALGGSNGSRGAQVSAGRTMSASHPGPGSASSTRGRRSTAAATGMPTDTVVRAGAGAARQLIEAGFLLPG